MKIKAIVHEVEEGGFWAEVPSIVGCAAEGETVEEAVEKLYERIQVCLTAGIVPSEHDKSERVVEVSL